MPTIKLTAPERARLREYLTYKFSLPELRVLAFDLGIDYQHIPHTTTIELAPEFIMICERTEQLPELLELALERRPNPDIAALLQRLKPAPPPSPPPIPTETPSPVAKTELTPSEAEQLDLWFSQLEKAETDEDWDRVISLGEQILTLDSDISYVRRRTAIALGWKGLSFGKEGKHNQAITQYTKAIKLDPTFANSYFKRGNAYADLKRHERAIVDYDVAVKLDPDAAGYNNRGITHKALRQYEQAIADYDMALKFDPDDAAAYNNRGNAYDGLKQYERAITDYTQAIKLDPNDAYAYYNRGLSYKEKGDKEAARRDFQQAVDLGDAEAKKQLQKLG